MGWPLLVGGVVAFGAFIGGVLAASNSGETIAENFVDIVADESTTIIREIIMKNNTYIFATNDVEINDECQFKNNIINQRNVVSIDTKTLNDVFSSDRVETHMKVKIDQMAEALAEMLKAGGGDNTAKNISGLTLRMSTQIKEYIATDCGTAALLNNSVRCSGKGAVADSNYISQENFVSVFKECLQRVILNDAVNKQLDIDLTARAKAETKNALVWVVLVAVITLSIVMIVLLKTIVKSLTDWRFIAAATPLVVFSVYLIVAHQTNRWPFNLRDLLDPKNNKNIVMEDYDNDDVALSPLDLCKQKGHHSVQYVEYVEKGARLLSYEITKPRNSFRAACRKEPSPLVQCPPERPYQCPNIQGGVGACCTSGEMCNPLTGLCAE